MPCDSTTATTSTAAGKISFPGVSTDWLMRKFWFEKCIQLASCFSSLERTYPQEGYPQTAKCGQKVFLFA